MPEPDMSVWTGRVDAADGPRALRWHQMMKPLVPGCDPGKVLIGFACDEGVRRNGGRTGARDGPRAIRAALANLAWHQDSPAYDAGDVRCDNGDLEGAQERLARAVAGAIAAGHQPLVLGGGHETAWGTFQGIAAARPEARIACINFDAHFDLRADVPGNSGTPFLQIATWCNANERPFRYLCLGVAEPANTMALFDRARDLGARWHVDAELPLSNLETVLETIIEVAREADVIHLGVDLDVLPAATMPAVSAPAARGVAIESVLLLVAWIVRHLEVAAIDLVEFNPQLDPGGLAVRTAARVAWQVSTGKGREEQ